jgi:hypothetical protein
MTLLQDEIAEVTMQGSKLNQSLIILMFGLIGWALCGAIMFIGMALTPNMQLVLIIHAVGAPLIFGLLTWIYTARFGYTKPWITAVTFLLIVVLMDFFVVSLLINRNFDMFTSFLGTWLPFLLIFSSTYLVARLTQKTA